MQFHIPNSHPSNLIGSKSSVYIEVSLSSFVANASNPYFIGDRNSNHPIHFGKSFRFFQKPENKINGIIKAFCFKTKISLNLINIFTGAIAVATFTSPNKLPTCNPNAFPLKLQRILISTKKNINNKK